MHMLMTLSAAAAAAAACVKWYDDIDYVIDPPTN